MDVEAVTVREGLTIGDLMESTTKLEGEELADDDCSRVSFDNLVRELSKLDCFIFLDFVVRITGQK